MIQGKEGLVFTEVDGHVGLTDALNKRVYIICEHEENEDYQGTEIVFYDEDAGKYITYLFYKDGDIYKTEWY